MGGACGKATGEIYRDNLSLEQFYAEKLEKQLAEMYSVFGMTDSQGYRFFQYFVAIDDDGGGTVDQVEFHEYFDITMTPFTERVYGQLDVQDTGELYFQQFLIGVWNICTLDHPALVRYIFIIFDIDGGGELDLSEVDALCRMLYNVEESPDDIKKVVASMDTDGDGAVSLSELVNYTLRFPALVEPAVQLQASLRKEMFGTGFWKRLTKTRQKKYGADTSVEDILISLRRESQKKKAEEQRTKSIEDDKQKLKEEEQLRLDDEKATKKKNDEEEKRRSKETDAETTVRLALDALEDARDAFSAIQSDINPALPNPRKDRKLYDGLSMFQKAKVQAKQKLKQAKEMAEKNGLVETKALWDMTEEERNLAQNPEAAAAAAAALAGNIEPTFEQKAVLEDTIKTVKRTCNVWLDADVAALADEKARAIEKSRTDVTKKATKLFKTEDGMKLMKMMMDDELRIMGPGGMAASRMTKAKEQATENYIARKTREVGEVLAQQFTEKKEHQLAEHMAFRDEIIDELGEEKRIVKSWGWIEMVDEASQSPYYLCEATDSSLWTVPVPNITSKCCKCNQKLMATLRCEECQSEMCHECDPTIHFGNKSHHTRYPIEEEELRWRRLRRRFDLMLRKSKKATSLPILAIDFLADAR
jgi:Ca2+-binding EF-hand superfamily protein